MLIRKSSMLIALTAAVALVGGAGVAHAAKGAKGAKGGHAGGKVKSVDAATKSFVVERANKQTGDVKDVTVITTDTTDFKKGDAAAKWSDIKTGIRVRAQGTMGVDGKLTATSVEIGGHKKAAAATTATTAPAAK
jgi:hypothetical protein